MPYAAVLRGCLRTRPRMTMSLVPSTAALLRSPTAPQNPTSNPTPGLMKSHSAGGGVYVPPIPRLRSVIASANGTLTTARSVDYDWRDAGAGQGAITLNPTAPAPAAADGFPPYFRQQSSHYARYAYDDYSDDDSDRDMEVSPASSKVGSLLS